MDGDVVMSLSWGWMTEADGYGDGEADVEGRHGRASREGVVARRRTAEVLPGRERAGSISRRTAVAGSSLLSLEDVRRARGGKEGDRLGVDDGLVHGFLLGFR